MQHTLAGITAIFLIMGSVEAMEIELPNASQLTFKYEDSTKELISKFPLPDKEITSQDLALLCKEVDFVVDTSKLSDMDQTILPAYLANAQKDFAWLSYLLTGKLTGCLTPVTLWTLQLFLPEASLPDAKEHDFDVYTCCLAALVVEQAAKRLQEERAFHHDYQVKKTENSWTPTSSGYKGLNFGSMKTWYLSSSDQLSADPLPSDEGFWKSQTQQVEKARKEVNGQETEAVFRWAELSEPGAGNWHPIFSKYLQENNVPVMKQLYVRAVLFSALADSNAAAFNSKYSYWIQRPSQKDPSIHPLISVPNHPSYPSAHSTISGTAAVILSHFFPENTENWQKLAEEAGWSRIWGGIHYPIDHQNGLKLGKLVGQKALENLESNTK